MKYLPPSRTLWAILLPIMMWTTTIFSQSLKSAEGNAIAGFSMYNRGISSLDWNPAGIATMKDWELGTTYFHPMFGSNNSISLHNAVVGKHFSGNQSAVMQISPGSILEFKVPSTFKIGDSSASVISSFDKTISYSEMYSLAYAYQFGKTIALGISANALEEKVSDTKYSIDTNNIIRSTVENYQAKSWNMHLGATWSITPNWIAGAGVQNLVHITESPLPDEELQYALGYSKIGYAGIGYRGLASTVLSMEADTKKRMRLGVEWSPTDYLQARSGAYVSLNDNVTSDAIAFGLGTSFQFIHADISYVTFRDQSNRQGTVDINKFEEFGIDNIDFNPFTSDRITLTLSVQLGRQHENLTRIEYVDVQRDVYPASSMLYASQPIGKAGVRNISTNPIEIKVQFYLNTFMDTPTETPSYILQPNEVKEIPFVAVFNTTIQSLGSMEIHDGNITVTNVKEREEDDSYQARVLIHGKNDWDGDIHMLKYFVTPSDPAVINLSRNTLSNSKQYLDSIAGSLQLLTKAKLLFNDFVSTLVYINDPKLTQDFVQYPSETITRQSGDCDDISVAYATLLSSIGISTAFVDVVPPNKPDDSHIYIMFNTGITPDHSNFVSENPKRFVIRKDEQGNETVWIPIETTAVRKGFEEAWQIGADEYFQDVELHSGITKGWVRIVDILPVQ